MGKFRQKLTELSARDKIMAGYYSLTFVFAISYGRIIGHILPDLIT